MGAIQNAVNSALGATSKAAIAKGIGDAVINTGAEKLANDTINEVENDFKDLKDKTMQVFMDADPEKDNLSKVITEEIEKGKLAMRNKYKEKGIYDLVRDNFRIIDDPNKGVSVGIREREALKKSAKELYLKQHNTNSWKAGVNAIFNRLTGGGKE